MKKIIFTGGGTAGHVTPNLALMDALAGRYEMEYILGGIRVIIPYHTKEGEFKYNILQTGHKIKRTNDKAVFLRLIKQSLSKMDSLSLKYDSPTLGSKNGE